MTRRWRGQPHQWLWVDSDRYLLTMYRYIELNPVRAAMVATPEAHRWSSVHAPLGLHADTLVTPHEVFLRPSTARPASGREAGQKQR